MLQKAILTLLFTGILMAAQYQATTDTAPKMLLSDYAFFRGDLAALQPASGVFPYEVNAPLFSDYAEKARFIYLPSGTSMMYQSDTPFDFPDGAVIIKSFFYYKQPQKPEAGRKIIETRLLLKEPKGWKALDYVWDENQQEARLEVAGATIPMQWKYENAKKQAFDYIVPNVNQCKGCHSYDGRFVPIGITARQLNRGQTSDNQLLAWQKLGILQLPADFDLQSVPQLVDYRSHPTNDNPLNPYQDAARSYLDANCAHCHNPHGPASTSGMFLGISESNEERLGIGKPPVAAGRGSGGRRFGIVPGKPAESILLFRMESDDPGIKMPELGRQLSHDEGIALVRQWIKNMK